MIHITIVVDYKNTILLVGRAKKHGGYGACRDTQAGAEKPDLVEYSSERQGFMVDQR
jgi:hypothetical protein